MRITRCDRPRCAHIIRDGGYYKEATAVGLRAGLRKRVPTTRLRARRDRSHDDENGLRAGNESGKGRRQYRFPCHPIGLSPKRILSNNKNGEVRMSSNIRDSLGFVALFVCRIS